MGKQKHGDSHTRLYKTWQSMRYRCQNKNHTAYIKYGAKGIKVCRSWDESYLVFRQWAYRNYYKDSLTIDRINPKKGYSPKNCRWVGYDIQNTNLSMLRNNTSGIKGVSWNKKHKKWRCNISIKNKTKHIGDFPSILSACEARNKFIDDNNLPHQKVSPP